MQSYLPGQPLVYVNFMGAAAVIWSLWSHVAASSGPVRLMALTNSCAGVRFRTGGTKKYDRGTMNRSDFLMTVAVKSSFSKMILFRRAPNQFSWPSDTPGHEASITAGSCLNLVHGDRSSWLGIKDALRIEFHEIWNFKHGASPRCHLREWHKECSKSVHYGRA